MIIIPKMGESLIKKLSKGDIKICHAPNESLMWAVKNLVGEVRYFNLGNNNGFPTKIVERFAQSHSYLY